MIYQKRICLSILALLISILPYSAMAQDKNTEEKDTIAFFRGVAVSVDLVGPLMKALGDYGQYEGAVRFNLKDKYFPVVELGYGMADYEEDPVTLISVKTKAPFFRVGCDFNVAKNIHDDYRILAGFRYAYTSYDFEMSHPGLEDPIWGGTANYGVNETCNCHWLEGTFGVDAMMVKNLRLGWTIRYRRQIKSNDGSLGSTSYIPGFGKAGKTNWGGTFNITFEL